GTGGGFKKFVRGDTDVQNASRPILAEEMAQARANGIEFIELPICFDALTVAVHPQNNWVDSMKVSELKKLWEPAAQGKITKWNQIRPEWPDQPIKLYGAGSDSGTFDYFTEAITGKAKASRGDYTGSEDDNVLVQGIEGDRYALGYLPYAYFAPHANRMKAIGIEWDLDSHSGKTIGKPAVKPSLEAVVAGIYNPLSRPLFIYVNKKAADTKPEVKQFVEFYLKNAAELAKEVKYLPLPAEAYTMAQQRFAKGETGTGFGGEPAIGLPVRAILERKPVQ
ncbi:MAG TPA: PstS family phosphate ABC transporter substrate-binding protein, partial [Opitutaceae bacterium]